MSRAIKKNKKIKKIKKNNRHTKKKEEQMNIRLMIKKGAHMN